MDTSGLPGKRDEAIRAGMTAVITGDFSEFTELLWKHAAIDVQGLPGDRRSGR